MAENVYGYDTKQAGLMIRKYKTVDKEGNPSPAFDHEEHAVKWEDEQNKIIDAKNAKVIEDAKPEVNKALERIVLQGVDWKDTPQSVNDSLIVSQVGGPYKKYTPQHLVIPDWKEKYDKMNDLNQAYYRLNNPANFPNYSDAQKEADNRLLYTKTGDSKYITDIKQKSITKEEEEAKNKAYSSYNADQKQKAINAIAEFIEMYKDNPAYTSHIKTQKARLDMLIKEQEEYNAWAKEQTTSGKRLIY